MSTNYLVIIAIGIGIVAGLRTFTAPAAVSWAAHLGWINLHGTPLAFMGPTITVGIVTLLALVEYVTDQLPSTPARTVPMQFIARLIMGGFSGACIYVSASQSLLIGVMLGAIGVVIGTYGGYHIRKALVSGLKVKDIFIAIPEDLVAIGLAYCARVPAMTMKKYDAIIIGSGQGGNPMAASLADQGWTVAIIEKEHLGGTCINTGCTPTKTMVHRALVAHYARNAARWGVVTHDVSVDLPNIVAQKNKIVQWKRDGQQTSIDKRPNLHLYWGVAQFTGPHELKVGDADR